LKSKIMFYCVSVCVGERYRRERDRKKERETERKRERQKERERKREKERVHVCANEPKKKENVLNTKIICVSVCVSK